MKSDMKKLRKIAKQSISERNEAKSERARVMAEEDGMRKQLVDQVHAGSAAGPRKSFSM